MGLVADLYAGVSATHRSGARAKIAAWALAALCGLALKAAPAAGDADAPLPPGLKLSAALSDKDIQGYGINPLFIVAVRLADGAQRLVIAEHRPGHGSELHVLKSDGAYGYAFSVPSPQLVDFTVDGAGSKAFLIGSLGTRFYTADLISRSAKLVMSSLPKVPGFRALPPVAIMRSAQGPIVYGVFYESSRVSREVGFGRVWDNGTATDLFPTSSWDRSLGDVLAYSPDPLLKSVLVVSQDRKKWTNPAKPKPKRLTLVRLSGEKREIDSADDLFGANWSPDGDTFVYVRRSAGRQELVLSSPAAGLRVLASGRYFAPTFLNGGKTLLVSTKEAQGNAVWTIDLPDGKPQRVELPPGPCIYTTDPSGQAFAAWGPWGLRAFTLAGS